ncbi:MAG: hypothetical protein IT429_00355 [Gemmataceae bacterium]|nr:hypothetical protein [Gemmataceae bacterium]
MKRLLTIAATLATLGAGTVEAHGPPHGNGRAIVDGWYHRFLGRCVDEAGACYWVPQLNRKPVEVVLTQLVASQEYYHRNGCSPEGFVRGLFRDVLGRIDVCERDVHYWTCKLQRCGCRETLVREFLCAVRVDVLALGAPPPPPAYAPAPPPGYAPAPTIAPPLGAPPAPPVFAPPVRTMFAPLPVRAQYAPPPPPPTFQLRLRFGR